ncbi:MAG: secretion protein, partial [Flavobacteriales bacterium]
MKKILFLLSVFLFAGLQAQGSCATDFVNKQLEEKYPEIRQKRLANEQKLRSMNISAYMDQIGASFSSNGDYTGQIYEIPVVVHVIEATGRNTPTDAQIEAWIDRANQMYAGTYPGYFPAGAGINESAVIPFKLVLAKRNPQCIATSGI